jgi:hypothetical protein
LASRERSRGVSIANYRGQENEYYEKTQPTGVLLRFGHCPGQSPGGSVKSQEDQAVAGDEHNLVKVGVLLKRQQNQAFAGGRHQPYQPQRLGEMSGKSSVCGRAAKVSSCFGIPLLRPQDCH